MPNQKPKKQKRFVFNDEKVKNSYGFSIPTNGISLKRFKKNPVMLDSHWNSTHSVLGNWGDVKAEKGLLTGLPVFDSEDEDATYIEGKVARGFIKSCSMGIKFHRDDLKYIGGKLILEKCELYEVSIVAVPSNANSIYLYMDDSETPLTDEEAQQLCLSITPVIDPEIIPNQNKDTMKIKLESAASAALGLTVGAEHDSAELSAKIVQLESEKKAAELKYSTLKSTQDQAELTAIRTKVETAQKAGKFSAEKIEDFVNLGIANPALLDSTLDALPAKKSLGAQITGGEGDAEVKSADDFQKLSLEAQLKFKAEQPEEYKKLFNNPK